MKKIYIALGVIIILVIAIVLVGKNGKVVQPPAPDVLFTHPSGAFSFEYPSTYLVNTTEAGVYMSATSTPDKPFAAILTIAYPNYIVEARAALDANKTLTETTIAGRKAFIHTDKSANALTGPQYLISADGKDNPSVFVVATLVPNPKEINQDQFMKILNTLKIDQEKFAQLAEKTIQDLKNTGIEAKIYDELRLLRNIAESAYYPAKGYTNLCKQTEPFNSADIRKLFADIILMAGLNNFSCVSTKSAYSLSAIGPKGNGWCVDSYISRRSPP
jgi:hypothetical protein